MATAMIQQKADKLKSQEGRTDAAARLGLEGELYAKKKDISKAKECYNQASQMLLEEMAYYK